MISDPYISHFGKVLSWENYNTCQMEPSMRTAQWNLSERLTPSLEVFPLASGTLENQIRGFKYYSRDVRSLPTLDLK